MAVKRILCFALCCVLLLPLTATAQPVYNETLRLQMGGDVDGDGAITSTDARLVLQYAVEKVSDKDLNTAIADMDEDGSITSTDARLILQYAVGKESLLPRPESLTYEKLETVPAGEIVSFKATEVIKDYQRYYGYSTAHRFSVAQTPAEWDFLRAAYGFTTTYEEAFFEQNALVVCDVWMNATMQLLEIKQVTKNGSALELHVRKYYNTPYSTQEPYYSYAAAEIPKSTLAGVKDVAVYIQSDLMPPYQPEN